ncbi:MAG TPA: imelysin family protein [Polyangiaceae bacterium]|nr:imelysin family protein [Polyangiaceae bacterium]
MTSARLWLSFAGGAGILVALSVGACRKPGPDEIVYTGERRSPSDDPSSGGSSSPTGGSSGTSGTSSGASSGARGGTSGDAATGGRDPNGSGGQGSSEAGAGGEAGRLDPGRQCPTVPVNSGTFSKRRLLEAVAACTVRELCFFQSHAATLRDRAATAASEPSEDAAAAAREAWLTAMASWEGLELFQFGPAAASLNPGGQGLRDRIYSWPLVARCKVDEQVVNRFYANDAYFGSTSTSLTSGRTLHALEYLLFYSGTDNGCSAYSSINSTGSWRSLGADELRVRRRDYAARAAADVWRQAETLALSWSQDGGDFGPKLVEAGPVYASEQVALNAVGNALFYLDTELKDSKIQVPLGLDVACPTERCPDQVEALYARTSVDHIAQNLRGFRRLFQGCADGNAGFGFDDWLIAVGAGDLATRMLAALDAADAVVASLDTPLEVLIVNEPARVQAVNDAIKRISDLLKTEFMAALNIERPPGTPGDND